MYHDKLQLNLFQVRTDHILGYNQTHVYDALTYRTNVYNFSIGAEKFSRKKHQPNRKCRPHKHTSNEQHRGDVKFRHWMSIQMQRSGFCPTASGEARDWIRSKTIMTVGKIFNTCGVICCQGSFARPVGRSHIVFGVCTVFVCVWPSSFFGSSGTRFCANNAIVCRTLHEFQIQ